MSQVDNALRNEFQLLALLHDELALQEHLFKADTKAMWESLETQWGEFKEHLGRTQVATVAATHNIDISIKLLAESLKVGYTDIANTFKH